MNCNQHAFIKKTTTKKQTTKTLMLHYDIQYYVDNDAQMDLMLTRLYF